MNEQPSARRPSPTASSQRAKLDSDADIWTLVREVREIIAEVGTLLDRLDRTVPSER
jgi:hypothetical protein